MIWIVNVNSNLCRIYDYQKSPAQVTLIKEINHPENKLKAGDLLTSDKPGHYKSRDSVHGAYQQRTDPKEVEIDHFAREVARELDHGRNKQLYEQVIVIAPPHISGLLMQHTDKHVKDLIYKNIHKDILHMKDHELLDFLKTHAKYPDGE
jgi:protein required for attachment to host cells